MLTEKCVRACVRARGWRNPIATSLLGIRVRLEWGWGGGVHEIIEHSCTTVDYPAQYAAAASAAAASQSQSQPELVHQYHFSITALANPCARTSVACVDMRAHARTHVRFTFSTYIQKKTANRSANICNEKLIGGFARRSICTQYSHPLRSRDEL